MVNVAEIYSLEDIQDKMNKLNLNNETDFTVEIPPPGNRASYSENDIYLIRLETQPLFEQITYPNKFTFYPIKENKKKLLYILIFILKKQLKKEEEIYINVLSFKPPNSTQYLHLRIVKYKSNKCIILLNLGYEGYNLVNYFDELPKSSEKISVKIVFNNIGISLECNGTKPGKTFCRNTKKL